MKIILELEPGFSTDYLARYVLSDEDRARFHEALATAGLEG